MRIFTTMLVALLSILGGCNLQAQVTVTYESTSTPASEITTGYYVIKAKYKSDSERWAYMNGTFTRFTTNNPTTLSNVWYIELKDENSFYIKNASTNTYIKLPKSLSPEAADADNGGNLTSTFNKSDATYFCANANFQLNASHSKIDNNAFTIYAGSKASNGTTRQHIHANSIGNESEMAMSSWSTAIGSENVGESTVGQFAFYKASITETAENGQSHVALSTNCLYYMKASNGLYFTNDCKFSTSQDNAIKVYVSKRSDGYFELHDSPKKLTCSAGRAWNVAETQNSSTTSQDQWQVFEVEGINQYCVRNMYQGYISTGTNDDLVPFNSSPELISFIPANESATAARDLKLNIQSGDGVHGNVATFSATYPVSLPEGCTAYTATHDEANNVINMTALEGSVIPANTGVLVKSEITGEVAMKPTLEAGTAVTNNKLVSVGDAAKNFTSEDNQNVYLLGRSTEGTLCFRIMNTSGTQTIAAHKAYIQLDNPTQAANLQINFGGEVTNINNATINDTNAKAVYYDLSGRRVMRPQHGLYIVNGKKIIIK